MCLPLPDAHRTFSYLFHMRNNFVVVGVHLLPPLESLFFESLENILFSLYSPQHVFLVSHSIHFDM